MKQYNSYHTSIKQLANRPHQIWHADFTVVKCLNRMKYYVFLLMDNFSRYILNYQVSEKGSAEIRMQSIKQAYDSIKILLGDICFFAGKRCCCNHA